MQGLKQTFKQWLNKFLGISALLLRWIELFATKKGVFATWKGGVCDLERCVCDLERGVPGSDFQYLSSQQGVPRWMHALASLVFRHRWTVVC